MQREYLDRLDFKYTTPKQTQILADLQYRSREADLNQTTIYLMIHEKGESSMSDELYERMRDEKQKSVYLENQYFEYWDANQGHFDIRNYFTKVPESTCPAENWDIPDTDLNELFKEEEKLPILSPNS